jgi:hypothetical protein
MNPSPVVAPPAAINENELDDIMGDGVPINLAARILHGVNTENCANPVYGTMTPIIRDFRYLHENNLKPVSEMLSRRQYRALQTLHRYLTRIHMYPQRLPQTTGERDVVYHMHSASHTGANERRNALGTVYQNVPANAQNMVSAVLSRAPCRFPKIPRRNRRYRCAATNHEYTVQSAVINRNRAWKLPGDLHGLIYHAAMWGAQRARETQDTPTQIATESIEERTSMHEHAADFIRGLAKDLNIGGIRDYGQDDVARRISPEVTWSLIQSHMWAGHRCLLSEYRKNWMRGFYARQPAGAGGPPGGGPPGGGPPGGGPPGGGNDENNSNNGQNNGRNGSNSGRNGSNSGRNGRNSGRNGSNSGRNNGRNNGQSNRSHTQLVSQSSRGSNRNSRSDGSRTQLVSQSNRGNSQNRGGVQPRSFRRRLSNAVGGARGFFGRILA